MSEADARAREEKLATEANKQLADRITASRNWYAVLAIVMFLLGGGIALTGQWMLVFIFVVVGLIGVLQCMDAHGELHEVRRRSNKTLFPRTALLDRPESGSTAKAPSPSH